MQWQAVWFAALTLLAGTLGAGRCAAAEPPMVAGFERFFSAAPDSPAGGRLLAAELGCTHCHSSSAPPLAPKPAPKLHGLRLRLQPQWVTNYLQRPHAEMPGSTMPDVLPLDPAARQQEAAALTHFLFAQPPDPSQLALEFKKTEAVAVEYWKKGQADRGQELFHRVGCVACHEPDATFAAGQAASEVEQRLRDQGLDEEEILEWKLAHLPGQVRGRRFPQLAEKYTLHALVVFLLEPHRTRPAGRMPSLGLTPEEATDVAWYLTGGAAPEAPTALAIDPQLVAQGAALFQARRCSQCHASPLAEPAAPAVAPAPARAWSELAGRAEAGCLGDSPAVRYDLAPPQQAALAAALASSDSNLTPETPAERLNRGLLQANCLACHARGGQGGVGQNRWAYFETWQHVDLGDEGRIPPKLDDAGRKFRRQWLEQRLRGAGDVRPHMLARMPRFVPELTQSMAEDFASVDANSPAVAQPPAPHAPFAGDVEGGRRLLNVGCIQCHPLRGERLPGVIGIDLALAPERLRYDWFYGLLAEPARQKPGTRMPAFFPNGRSNSPEILDGDVPAQIAAVWSYLTRLDAAKTPGDVPLPDRLVQERLHNTELVPAERPIVLRTFLEQVGTHAVAVGYPQGLSLAFDAREVRPALVWRGRFLDAHGTWFDRFAPHLTALGPAMKLPPAPPFAVLAAPDAAWPASNAEPFTWRGYRLDSQGRPTFLYRWRACDIEERWTPAELGLLRQVRLRAPNTQVPDSGSPWLLIHADQKLQGEPEAGLRDTQGLLVRLRQPAATSSVRRRSADRDEWLVPWSFPETGLAQFELSYEW